MTEVKNRVRLRAEGYTIDGPYSRDLDDAIFLEPEGKGWILHVSIADVASAVLLDSPLDLEARMRGSTRYFAEGNDPMLPRNLSEDALSLWEHKERKTITVSIPIGENFSIGKATIRLTTLVSKAKLSYQSVDSILADASHVLHSQLTACCAVAQVLMERRREKGAFGIYDILKQWATTEEGFLMKINPEDAHLANIIVQEFMILTNEAVAQFFIERNVPVLFRNHTAQAMCPDRTILMSDILKAIQYPDQFPIGTLETRTRLVLNKAVYAPELLGHYGLNLPAYLHFTSPIRRYADLVNHRMLIAILSDEPVPYTIDQLRELGQQLTAIDWEIRLKKSDTFKEFNIARIAGLISNDQYLHLYGKDMTKVIKVACRENKLTTSLEAEIVKRLQENRLTPQDMYFLLFETNEATDAWIRVKKQTLKKLEARKCDAISVLEIGSQLKRYSFPVFRELKSVGENNSFTIRAELVSVGAVHFAEASSERKKVVAKNRACYKLILVLVKKCTPGLKIDSSAKKFHREIAKDSPPKKVTAEDQMQTNFKGALLEMCQAHGWPVPLFSPASKGPAHQATFSAFVSVTIDGKKHEAFSGATNTKKFSEQLAASNLLEQLLPFAKKVEPVSDQSSNGAVHNYVAALQEFCAKRSRPLPSYVFDMRGPSHVPEVACMCAVTVPENPDIVFTAKGSNKKEAKQAAAKLVFVELTHTEKK